MMAYVEMTEVVHGQFIDEDDYNLMVANVIDHHSRVMAIGGGGAANLPIGTIIFYYGLPSALNETGWAICDGTNGTVDLRDKFILGAGDTYDVGDEGGSTGTHDHDMGDTDEGGAHSHNLSGITLTWSTSNGAWSGGANNVAKNSHTHGYSATISTGNHAHGIPDTDPANGYPPYKAIYLIERIL